MSIEADGRRNQSNFGEWNGDTLIVEMPKDNPYDVEIEPPIGGSAEIRTHTRCAGGPDRDWPDSPLQLTLEYNGDVVGEDTAQGQGDEAQVTYEPDN